MHPRVGIISLARSTFDVEYAQELFLQAKLGLENSKLQIVGNLTLLFSEEEAIEELKELSKCDLDLLLVLQVTFTDASMVVKIPDFIEDTPIILWSYPEERTGKRLRINSFCGINLASHSLSRLGIRYDWIHDSPQSEKAFKKVRTIAKANMIKKEVKNSKILVIGSHPVGFDACSYNEEKLKDLFGISVDQMDILNFIEQAKLVKSSKVDEVYEKRKCQLHNLDDMDSEATRKTFQVYIALKELIAKNNYLGVAIRCWPEFFTDFGCAACGAVGMINEMGVPMGCEADLFGVVTSKILSGLSGSAAFNTDMVDVDFSDNTVVFWHCGQAPIDMASGKSKPCATIHSNRKLPLLSEFPLKEGKITLARFTQGRGKIRLALANAEMIERPLAYSGTSGVARFSSSSLEHVIDKIIKEGLEHHSAIVYGDYREELVYLADLYGIEIVELDK